MFEIKKNNFAEIYYDLLEEIYYFPDHMVNPRGLKVKEKLDVELILTNPLNNLYLNEIRSPKLTYLYPELLWYFKGENDLDFISRYSKFWNKISNNGINVNSGYGKLIFKENNKYNITEWKWALTSLIKDKYSRQSIIRFNKPDHSYYDNKDFPCTLNGIFSIRDNKLNFKITMRSQDVWFGIIYDIPFFTLLQQQMLNHLLPFYPNLKLGVYKHHVYNIHMYERNFEKIKYMLEYKFIDNKTPKLEENLIDSNGISTIKLNELYDVIKNYKETINIDTFNDELYKKLFVYSWRKK